MRDKKRLLKLAAVSLAVCLATPSVVAPAGTTTIYAAEETQTTGEESFPLLDAATKNEKVVMAKTYEGEQQVFNGQRADEFNEDAGKLHKLTKGSVILRFKVDPTNNTVDSTGKTNASVAGDTAGVLLGVRNTSSSKTINPIAKGNDLATFSIRGSSNNVFRFVFNHEQAEKGYNYADGEWHTVVFTSNESGKIMRLTVDGQEQWDTTTASCAGFFNKEQTALDQLTIGGMKNGEGDVIYGFKGSISHVIVTEQEISDADAVKISYEGWSAKPEIPNLGGDFANLFNNGTDKGDNSWIITGGDAVKGGYEQTEGRRNYGEHFEEYIRFSTAANRLVTRQRYVFNAGRKGYDIAKVVSDYDTLVTPYGSKAAAYMVGVEDYSKGAEEATLTTFKGNIKSFIEKSIALKSDNGGYAVIQTPFATNDEATNAIIEKYVDAVKEVIKECATDPSVAAKIQMVDHYAMTVADSNFKTNCLKADNTLNAKGHLEIGRHFARIVKGTDSGYPATGVDVTALDERRVEAPSKYLKVLPTVTGADSSLNVTIPKENGTEDVTEWQYTLTMGDVVVEGNADSNEFTITGLVQDADYVLKIRSKDGVKQITTVQGTVKVGDTATQYKQTLDEKQKAIADKMEADDSLTWIFMGDSITHSSRCTYGYKGVAQLFRDFIQDGLGREKDMVINTAVGNANSADTVRPEILEQRIGKFTPDIVSIQLGTNDAVREGSFENGPAREVISTEDYIANIETIIDKIEERNPNAIIILRTPIPTFDQPHELMIPDYVRALKALAEERGCMYVDQYTEWRKQMDPYSWLSTKNHWGFLFDDIVHPNAIGHIVLQNMFIKACGLWTEDTPMTNLNYKMQITDEESAVVPEVQVGTDKIVVSVDDLKTASNMSLGAVEVKATNKASGQSYTTSVDVGETEVVLRNLPEGTYSVQVSSHLTNTAKKVTFETKEVVVDESAPVVIDAKLSNKNPRELSAGAVVGNFFVSALAPDGDYTYTLVSGEGSTDNNKFEIKNGQLVIKEALTEGQTYSVRVKVQTGDNSEEDVYEIYAMGSGFIFEKSDMEIASGRAVDLSQESYASKVMDLEEGTIIVEFTSTSDNTIQSLFSIANKNNGNGDKNRHFHVYVKPDGTIGTEIRNNDSYGFTTDAVLKMKDNGTNVKNVIAFKADKENKQYKVFANGELVKTYDAGSGFRFADIVDGANAISVGGTMREGAVQYPFGGTIHNLKVYALPLSDEELKVATGGESGEEPGDTNVAVTGVSLNKTSLTLTVGGEEQLEAIVAPVTATNKNVTWSVVEGDAVTVTDGKVKAVKPGTAKVKVVTADGNKEAVCTVTVNAATSETMAVENVTLDKDTTTLKVGEDVTLVATVTPDDATNQKVTWSVEGTAVTVDQNGKVTAVEEGTATVTVTTEDGEKTASCEVIVEKASEDDDNQDGDEEVQITYTGITLSDETLEKEVGSGGKLGIEVKFTAPEGTEVKEHPLKWSTSDENVVTVDEKTGDYQAVGVGTATLTVTVGDQSASCTITVKDTKAEQEEQKAEEEKQNLAKEKEAATKLLNAAAGLKQESYSADTWKTYETALNNLKKLMNDSTATSTQIASAKAALDTAIKGLKPAPQTPPAGDSQGGNNNTQGGQQQEQQKEVEAAKNALNNAIQNATTTIQQSAYTKETFDTFQTALKEVESILNNPNATKAEVEAATLKLHTAIKGLKPATTQKPEEEKPAEVVKPGVTFKSGTYQFKITSATEAQFTGVASSIKTVKIANTIQYGGKTLKVTSVANNALKGDKVVTKVVLGSNIKNIGNSAFEGCTKLTSVNLKNVTKIGNKAFKKATSLKKVTIPKKVTNLGKSVFEGCKKLSAITIKATALKRVGKNTFKNISTKAKIKVPKKNLAKYKKLLKNKGQGKKVSIR